MIRRPVVVLALSALAFAPQPAYAYRDHPEPFEVHIRRFLDEVQRKEDR